MKKLLTLISSLVLSVSAFANPLTAKQQEEATALFADTVKCMARVQQPLIGSNTKGDVLGVSIAKCSGPLIREYKAYNVPKEKAMTLLVETASELYDDLNTPRIVQTLGTVYTDTLPDADPITDALQKITARTSVCLNTAAIAAYRNGASTTDQVMAFQTQNCSGPYMQTVSLYKMPAYDAFNSFFTMQLDQLARVRTQLKESCPNCSADTLPTVAELMEPFFDPITHEKKLQQGASK